jgi:hypothetical protein
MTEILSLKGNNFTSSFPFKAITSLAKLREFQPFCSAHQRPNRTYDSCNCHLCAGVMDISDFHFSGKLPAAIGNLTSLGKSKREFAYSQSFSVT